MLTLLMYPMLFAGAVLAALATIFILWASYRYTTSRNDSYFVVLLFWLIGFSAIAFEVLSHREAAVGTLFLSYMDGSGGLVSSETFLGSLIGKVSSIFIVTLATIRFITGSNFFNSPAYVFAGINKLDPAKQLLGVYLIYFSFSGLLSSVLGTKPAFIHWMFYPVLIMGATFFSRCYDTKVLVRHAKWVLLILIYGSLIAGLINPNFAFEHGYRGLIPGINIRLYGLAAHPNTLGPVALLFLVLEYLSPSLGRIRILNMIGAIAVLLLAQSKTAYVAAFLAFGVIFVYKYSKNKNQRNSSNRWFGVLTIFLLGTSVLLLLVGLSSLFEIKIFSNSFSYLDSQNIKYLTTFTGRTKIWDITLNVWKDNPLFGYGPLLWSPEFRASYGLNIAGQAHNQFIQTLGESGVFGLLGLLFYLFVLIRAAIATVDISRGASLALLAIPLTRTLSESPFRNFVINDWAFFTHLVIFCLLVGWLREKSTATPINNILKVT